MSYKGKELYKKEDWLKKEYVEKDRSTHRIAENFNVTHATISHYLNKFEIIEGRERSTKYKYICPDCHIPQRSPSMHFSSSDCKRPEIDRQKREMIKRFGYGRRKYFYKYEKLVDSLGFYK